MNEAETRAEHIDPALIAAGLAALSGIGCHNEKVSQRLQSMVESRGLSLSVKSTPTWYF